MCFKKLLCLEVLGYLTLNQVVAIVGGCAIGAVHFILPYCACVPSVGAVLGEEWLLACLLHLQVNCPLDQETAALL